jgi:hypothetical protein
MVSMVFVSRLLGSLNIWHKTSLTSKPFLATPARRSPKLPEPLDDGDPPPNNPEKRPPLCGMAVAVVMKFNRRIEARIFVLIKKKRENKGSKSCYSILKSGIGNSYYLLVYCAVSFPRPDRGGCIAQCCTPDTSLTKSLRI